MPIRPDLKLLYPANWKEISQQIRFVRASGRCERCDAPHGGIRLRSGDVVEDYHALNQVGFQLIGSKIILTTAHLNHDPRDNHEENLAALCQKCHLAHDLLHHLASRRINREKRTGQRRLFER